MIRNKYIRKSAYKTKENEPKYLVDALLAMQKDGSRLNYSEYQELKKMFIKGGEQ